ncbi:MAG TPA: hypothetical protein G4O02_00755 [Caldilineae bacterium]|nr:hypothetical protein [Caldilineae bacterium]
MHARSRYAAFLAYLLNVVGWIYGFLFHRRDPFVMYHIRQSIGLTLAAIVVPIAWVILAWVLTWVPLAGALLSAMLFALVIGAYLALAAAWIVGMVRALRGRARPVPFIGRWANRLPVTVFYEEARVAEKTKATPA